MNTRMDNTKLHIGTYILDSYARTERHVRELAECGVDLVICVHRPEKPLLDAMQKYGIGCIASGILPGWWGGDGQNAGQMAETRPLSMYEEAARNFTDHEAIWGVDVGDEPSALDFPHYGKVTDAVERLFPRQFAYLNLYPNYAVAATNTTDMVTSQLGTPSYEAHIRRYTECVGLDYISFDTYLYSHSWRALSGYLDNMRIVADACRNTGRRMWVILQVNSNRPAEWITEDRLRFQANTSMAYGAEVISWACWCAGWWHNQVLDDKGEKTEQYEKLQTVNREILSVAGAYMRYRRVETHYVGFADDDPDLPRGCASGAALDTGVFFGVHADAGERLLVGQMTSRDGSGRQALWIADVPDPYEAKKPVTVTLRTNGRAIRVRGASEAAGVGGLTFTMPPCGGVLVETE